jgi:methyltransferase (TIGR00027 family)
MKKLSEEKKQSSIEQRASHTALMAAIHRFIASKEEKPNFQGPDYLAKVFLPPKAKILLSFSFIRRALRKKLHKTVPGGYEYVTARTNHFDRLFKNALEENIPQVVFLGAGYDTRAIRFKDNIQQTNIFELDAPTTQQNKKKLLQKHNISIPSQVSFVPINFSKENMDNVLSKAGYDKSLKSFFIWEGVTMYLPGEAIKETLAFIKNNSGRDSTVAFDYFYKSFIDGKCEYYGAKELLASVSKTGEPYQFGIEEGKINSFLSENGFEVLSHYAPGEFEKSAFNDNGESIGKMYGFACQVHARVKS